MSDPFTTVYDALWAHMETVSALTDLVLGGNRIKFDNKNPIRDRESTTDTPELRIIPTGAQPLTPMSSNSTEFIEQYEVAISTGDQRLGASLFPLRWVLFKALGSAQAAMIAVDLSTWNAKVTKISIVAVSDGAGKSDQDRGIEGWATFWEVLIQMVFQTSSL